MKLKYILWYTNLIDKCTLPIMMLRDLLNKEVHNQPT